MNDSQQHAWDSFYAAGRRLLLWPSESVVRFIAACRERLPADPDAPPPRALDLGCGNGRHLWLLARAGFVPAGLDISQVAADLANAALEAEGLPPAAAAFDGHTLPFDDHAFDLVLSHGVLDSMLPASAERLMAESVRVLRPTGRCFASVRSSHDDDFMRIGTQVAHHTVRVETDFERGTVQHFFDRDEVAALMAAFRDVRIEREDRIDFTAAGKTLSRWNAIGVQTPGR